MKTVVIDKKEAILSVEANAIKVDGQSIPFGLVDMLILNHKIALRTSDILKLTRADISVLIVSHANEHFSLIQSANAKNAQIKLAQYAAHAHRLAFAKMFISKKIDEHAKQLLQNGRIVEISGELLQIQNASSVDEIMGIEGAFAARYFKEYFALLPLHLHKSKRSKRPPLDPVNALLSYWYTLYYHVITVKLIGYGFEPSIGYLHTPFREHNALASDMLEIFRAQINEAVMHLFNTEILQQDDFSKKGGVYLKFDGRKKIWSHFLALCDALKPKLDEEIATLRRMIDEKKDSAYQGW